MRVAGVPMRFISCRLFTLTLTLTLLLIGINAWSAADIMSNGTGGGDWSNPASWDSGVPTANDTVDIRPGDTITIDTLNATSSELDITINGVLKFSTSVPSALTIVDGDLNVNTGGTLQMGTQADPIPSGITATLILAYGSSPGEYGLIINDGGKFYTYGDVKTPAATAASGPGGGGLNIQVAAADGVGWQAGDVITIGQTEITDPFEDQTEQRTIDSINKSGDPWVVSWTGALSYTHQQADGIRVANLTRNAVVRSSGTNAASNTAYIQNYTTTAADFQVAHTEFAYIGASGSSHLNGIVFVNTDTKGSISSSTFHNGYRGIRSYSENNETIFSHNVICQNVSNGMMILGDQNIIQYNDIFSNGGIGLELLLSASDGDISYNYIYSNDSYGIFLETVSGYDIISNTVMCNDETGIYGGGQNLLISSNTVQSGRSRGCTFTGLTNSVIQFNTFKQNRDGGLRIVNSSDNLISDNLMQSNDVDGSYSGGLHLTSTSRLVVHNNVMHSNYYYGIYMIDSNTDNVIAENEIYNNGEQGVRVVNVPANNTFVSNTVYANDEGIYVYNSTSNIFVNDTVGYNTSGAAAPNISRQLVPVVDGSMMMKNSRVYEPVTNFDTTLNDPGEYILSYNQNYATGTVNVYGDCIAPGDITLDYSQSLYASSATTPVLIKGTGHSAVVTPTNEAVTQIITVYYDGANWQVDGSVSGNMGAQGAGSFTADFPAGTPQFNLNFTQGSPPQTNDKLIFALMAGAQDANVQKQLLFSRGATLYRNSQARLTMGAGTELTLRGIDGTPTLMDRLASMPYYTMEINGALTLENADIRNTDAGGLQISGNDTVSISSTVFADMGVASSVCTYITPRDLTSNTTFYNVTFGPATSPLPSAIYNIYVQGDDSNLNWALDEWQGGRSGPDHEYDPNLRVRWLDDIAPSAVADLSASTGSNYGEVDLTWTCPGNNGSTGSLLPGSFRVFYSSTIADMAAATTAQAQVVISTQALPGTLHSYTIQGLLTDVVYYAQIWTADETPNYAGVSNVDSAQAGHPTPQPPSLVAVPFPTQIRLQY